MASMVAIHRQITTLMVGLLLLLEAGVYGGICCPGVELPTSNGTLEWYNFSNQAAALQPGWQTASNNLINIRIRGTIRSSFV